MLGCLDHPLDSKWILRPRWCSSRWWGSWRWSLGRRPTMGLTRPLSSPSSSRRQLYRDIPQSRQQISLFFLWANINAVCDWCCVIWQSSPKSFSLVSSRYKALERSQAYLAQPGHESWMNPISSCMKTWKVITLQIFWNWPFRRCIWGEHRHRSSVRPSIPRSLVDWSQHSCSRPQGATQWTHSGLLLVRCMRSPSTLLRYISFENQGQYRDHLARLLISGHLPLLIPDRPLQTGFAISRIIAIRSSVSQKSMDIGMKGSSCGENREGEENQISDHPSLKLCCTDSVLLTIWRHSPSFIFLHLYCNGGTIVHGLRQDIISAVLYLDHDWLFWRLEHKSQVNLERPSLHPYLF